MTSNNLTVEKLEKNWETYKGLIIKCCGANGERLLDDLGERLVMCPSSQRSSQSGAYPGGMIEHSISVAMQMKKINDTANFCSDTMSMLKVGLLHDMGKVGDCENDLFLEQDSEWHREKLGQMYKYNENIQKMSVSHRTLYLLQKYEISLSCDEWISIQLAQGSHFEENRFYVGHEPSLAFLLQQAKATVNHINNRI